MQQTPYQQMAKDFMDLWQKQIASAMSDKQFIHAMLEMFQAMQSPKTNETSRAATANPSDASHAEHGMLAELAFRLAMCERRIAALEQPKKREPGKSDRKRSAKPRK